MSGFKRFLCESPLKKTSRKVNGKDQLLGSYHQCYRLDGRLIAIGVLDLLPHCVSGVYFIYHSDFEQWHLGKLSALREATLALEGGYDNYYMGYYIHSCPKMRYKGEYKPQHVLDPESFEWESLDGELKQLLDKRSYVSLSRERRAKEVLADSANDKNDARPTPEQIAEDMYDFPYPTAAKSGAAVREGVSLFDLQVPGLMTVEQIENELDLGTVPLSIRGQMAEAQVRSIVTIAGTC